MAIMVPIITMSRRSLFITLLRSSVIAGHICVSALSHRHRWLEALQLLATMAQRRLALGPVAQVAAAAACERLGAWRVALGLGAAPLVGAAALNACPWAAGLQLLQGMRRGDGDRIGGGSR